MERKEGSKGFIYKSQTAKNTQTDKIVEKHVEIERTNLYLTGRQNDNKIVTIHSDELLVFQHSGLISSIY